VGVQRGLFFSRTWGAAGEIASDIFSLAFVNYSAQNLHQVKSDKQIAERGKKKLHLLPSLEANISKRVTKGSYESFGNPCFATLF